MKAYLEKVIKEKRDKMKELQAKSDASEDIKEVRAIGELLAQLRDEISDAEEQLKKLDDDGEGSGSGDGGDEGDGQRRKTPAGQTFRAASFTAPQKPEKREDVLGSMEYRKSFMKYVQTGEWDFRDASAGMVLTTDIGKIIPNTIMTEFIKELKVYGRLYNAVRKLNVQGGVEFPIEELVPTVSWISETTPSNNQSAPELKNSVSFGYHIAEAKIAQSLLSQVVSLSVFETEIARLLAEAFLREFDRVIVKGTGSGQPLGILKDSRVPTENAVTFSDADMKDWKKFRQNIFAKVPLAYRSNGVMVMTAATWESNIMTLTDANNRPLYSETYNAETGDLECRFAGRDVILVEPDILDDFDTAESGAAWGIYLRPTDYAINSNMQLGFKRYFNDDTNKWVNKGLCIIDGKLLDTKGVFVLKK